MGILVALDRCSAIIAAVVVKFSLPFRRCHRRRTEDEEEKRWL